MRPAYFSSLIDFLARTLALGALIVGKFTGPLAGPVAAVTSNSSHTQRTFLE